MFKKQSIHATLIKTGEVVNGKVKMLLQTFSFSKIITMSVQKVKKSNTNTTEQILQKHIGFQLSFYRKGSLQYQNRKY